MNSLARVFLATVSFGSLPDLLQGQATWIVDVLGRPGVNFSSIQAALDAFFVNDGDTLVVRGGTYKPFVASKGVRIVAQDLVIIDAAPSLPQGPAIVITSVPQGRCIVLQGLSARVLAAGLAPFVSIKSCPGSVVIERMSGMVVQSGNGWLNRSMLIRQSTYVAVSDSDLSSGGNGLEVSDSRLSFRYSTISCSVPTNLGTPGWPAMSLSNARVEIVSSTLTGAPGWLSHPTYGTQPAQPAIRALGLSSIRTGSLTELNAGALDPSLPGFAAPAIFGPASVGLYIDPGTIFGSLGPPIAGGATVTSVRASEVFIGDSTSNSVSFCVVARPLIPSVMLIGPLFPGSLGGAISVIDPLYAAAFPLAIGINGIGRLSLRLPDPIVGYGALAVQTIDLSATTLEQLLSFACPFVLAR